MKKRCLAIWCATSVAALCWAIPALGSDVAAKAKPRPAEKGGCPDATITIGILTDSYATETSWELVEQGGGIVGSGSGLPASTLTTVDVCVVSTSCYDFTIYDSYGDGIYSPGGYTVAYNGTEIANTMGGGFTGSSDTVGFIGGGCVLPTGACCEGTVCSGTVTDPECAGDWYNGEDCGTYVCPTIAGLDCPGDSLFSQNSMGASDSWSAGTSEADLGDGSSYQRYESYSGALGNICDIHWWGITGYYSTAWGACTDSNPQFAIKFYSDAGGTPGAEVSSYVVTPTISPTNEVLNGLFPLYYFSVPSLSPCTLLTDGWVSIQGLGDTDCWFLWMSGTTGDVSNCIDDGTGIVCGLPDNDYDLSMCLTGAYEPIFGACCDDDTGTCDDDVEIINCTGRFAADTLCSALAPPCGEVPGACCVGTECSQLSTAGCAAAGGTFLGEGSTCLPDICGCADATITIEVLTDSYPSETSWELVEQGGGVVASGSGLPASTLTTVNVCVSSTSCYDFTIYDSYGDGIYSPGGYTVSYNGTELANTMGGGFTDSSDSVTFIGGGCTTPTGACCVDSVCVGTVEEAECAGDWTMFEDCATFVCPVAVDTCPAGSLFGMTPDGPDDDWSFGTSEANATGSNYLRFENYGVLGDICDLHWWGIYAYNDGAWGTCTESDTSFAVKFYADAGGVPGAEVASYVVTPTITPTGVNYAGLFDLNYYSVPSLSPCVTQFDGWVSIQGLGDSTCWFLWASSHDGDLSSCIMTDGVQDCDTYLFDNAVCLTGEYIPQFGACCDDSTGTCDDNVEIINCTTRFVADTDCADLVPACGAVPGACCYPDGSCLDQLSGDCTGMFQGVGTACAGTICASPGDDCTNGMAVTLDLSDLPYTNANTNCGRGDVYDDASTAHCLYYYDSGEDMIYELTVTETMTVRIGLDPHGTTYSGVAIGDACPPTDSCLAAAYASNGNYRETGCVTLTPGTYYIQVDTWSTPDCIPAFDLSITECPAGGACCAPDETCTDVANAGECADLYMGDTTLCATTACPAANDVCDTANDVGAVPATVDGDLTGANTETPPACGDNPVNRPAQDLWYTVVGTGNTMTASLCGGASFDSRMSVFTGECADLACVDGSDDAPCARKIGTTSSLRKVGASSRPAPSLTAAQSFGRGDVTVKEIDARKRIADPEALQSEVEWCSVVGVTYYISVGTYSDYTTPGPFTLSVTDDGTPCEETYCGGSGGCDEYIANVEVGTINNASACDGYADYTAMSTDMAVGAPTDITVTIGNAYSSDKGGLWIDWNQDLAFTGPDEQITIAWAGAGPYVATITPPAGALLGETRMRVRLQYAGGDPMPCGTTSYGEVEDYSVRVVPPVGACCDGSTCTDGTLEGDCSGVWLGVGTVCGADCQPNGMADVCDLAYGTSPDCNATGVPDECELVDNDCNSNGFPDECDLAGGASPDCNGNDSPDECDIADGTSQDCQGDGIPDDCQLSGVPRAVVLSEGFEGGVIPPTGWTAVVNNAFTWELGDYGPAEGVYYATCLYDETYSGTQNEWIISSELTMSGTVTLSGQTAGSYYWGVDPYNNYDLEAWVVIGPNAGDGDDILIGQLDEDFWVENWLWYAFNYTFAAPSGTFRIGFRYYGYDGAQANLDAVVVEGEAGAPANDCNGNGVPDECDVPPIGTGPDCQPDGIPDACQLEGNDVIPPAGDGMPDECNGCGDGYVTPSLGEQCEGGVCCTVDCLFKFAGVACRPADGDCDVTESCTGQAATCPADVYKGSGTMCRTSTDKCDPPEACTGSGPACPADFAITECGAGDGCCPDGCTWQEDWDCSDLQQNPGMIPTMSQWGLLVLALLLAVLGKVYFGRRRATT